MGFRDSSYLLVVHCVQTVRSRVLLATSPHSPFFHSSRSVVGCYTKSIFLDFGGGCCGEFLVGGKGRVCV